MKKLISLLLGLALVFSLVACSSNNENSKTSSKTSEEILIEFLKSNGQTTYDNCYYITDWKYQSSSYFSYFVSYDIEEDEIYFIGYVDDDIVKTPNKLNVEQSITIPLDFTSDYSYVTYSYDDSPLMYVAEGNLNKKKFSKSNNSIDDIHIIGTYSIGNAMIEDMFETYASTLLDCIQNLIYDNTPVTLKDLGFVNYSFSWVKS